MLNYLVVVARRRATAPACCPEYPAAPRGGQAHYQFGDLVNLVLSSTGFFAECGSPSKPAGTR